MWLAKGRVSRSKQRWDDAIDAYEQAIKLGAGCDAYQRIGYILTDSRNPERNLDKGYRVVQAGDQRRPGDNVVLSLGG